MTTYTLKLVSGVNYNLYNGTTLVTDADLATLFGSAGSAFFVFDFDSGTPTNTTSLTIVDSNSQAVITNTGLSGIAENTNFNGDWSASATAFDTFVKSPAAVLDEAQMSDLMGKIKNAGSSVTVTQTTGTSTTDVMSQAATTNMIYPAGSETSHSNIRIGSLTNPPSNFGSNNIHLGTGISSASASTEQIIIGHQAGNIGSANECIAIGHGASADGEAITIGHGASTNSNANGVAFGHNARAWGSGNIAIGSQITTNGQTNSVIIGNGPAINTQYLTRSNEFCVHASTTANQPMVHSNVDTPTLGTDAANKNYVDSFYPVGTVYSSTSSTAPTFAGGTWTSIGSQTIGSSTVYYYERTA